MAVFLPAKLGTMRLNAARLNWVQPLFYATVAGTARGSNFRKNALTIRETLSSAPNTAKARVTGFVPSALQEIKLYLSSTAPTSLLFAGHIQRVQQVYEDVQANVAYDLDLIDYAWQLDAKRLVFATYTNVPADLAVLDLMSRYASGYTTLKVQRNLPTITITFVGERVSVALTKIAQLIGAKWKVDYFKDLTFVTTAVLGVPDPDPISVNNLLTLIASQDGTQVRTRIYVKGGRTTLVAAVSAGAATIGVQDTTPFSASGGSAITQDGQIVTYTGIGTASALPTPAAPTASLGYFDGANAVSINHSVDDGAGNITVTCNAAHGLSTGDAFVITGNGLSSLGPHTVASVTNSTVFVFTRPVDATSTVNNGSLRKCFLATSIQTRGTVCTVTTNVAHGFAAGMTVQLLFVTPSSYNGNWTIASVPSTTTFTITMSGHPADGTCSLGYSSPAVLAATSGSLSGGAYRYKVSLAGGTAETLASAASGSVSPTQVTAPDGTLPGFVGATGGSLVAGATYGYGFTAVTSQGETAPGTLTTQGLGGANTKFTISLPPAMFDDPRILSINIWRTAGNQAVNVGNLRYVGSVSPDFIGSTITFVDTLLDGSRGGPPPTANTTGGAIALSGVATSSDNRVASRKIYRTAAGGSTYLNVGAINDGTSTSYTDSQADSVLTSVEPGAASPFPGSLTGVPTSGAGSIGTALPAGSSLALWLQVDDATAQAAIAAIIGGDGVQEDIVDDPQLLSATAASAAATGDLTLFKAIQNGLTIESRDSKFIPGVTVTVNIGAPTNVNVTAVAQSVVVTEIEAVISVPYRWPRRHVEAAPTRFTLDDLLRRIEVSS